MGEGPTDKHIWERLVTQSGAGSLSLNVSNTAMRERGGGRFPNLLNLEAFLHAELMGLGFYRTHFGNTHPNIHLSLSSLPTSSPSGRL